MQRCVGYPVSIVLELGSRASFVVLVVGDQWCEELERYEPRARRCLEFGKDEKIWVELGLIGNRTENSECMQ